MYASTQTKVEAIIVHTLADEEAAEDEVPRRDHSGTQREREPRLANLQILRS